MREFLSFEESGRLGFSVRELEWLAYHSFNLASHLIEKAPLSDGIADHLLEFSYEVISNA